MGHDQWAGLKVVADTEPVTNGPPIGRPDLCRLCAPPAPGPGRAPGGRRHARAAGGRCPWIATPRVERHLAKAEAVLSYGFGDPGESRRAPPLAPAGNRRCTIQPPGGRHLPGELREYQQGMNRPCSRRVQALAGTRKRSAIAADQRL